MAKVAKKNGTLYFYWAKCAIFVTFLLKKEHEEALFHTFFIPKDVYGNADREDNGTLAHLGRIG